MPDDPEVADLAADGIVIPQLVTAGLRCLFRQVKISLNPNARGPPITNPGQARACPGTEHPLLNIEKRNVGIGRQFADSVQNLSGV